MTALVADIWTIFNAVLIVGWQIIIFLRKGSWPDLPLSSVFNKLESDRGAIYATASAGEIERSQLANVVDAMLSSSDHRALTCGCGTTNSVLPMAIAY